MKRVNGTTVHSNPVSELLRTLITSAEDSSGDRDEIVSRIRQVLYDPMLIGRVPFLHDNHPLVAEALTVSDAFEAVTNGMDNPDVYARLELIEKSSVVYPWKLFTQAVRAFYADDPVLMQEYLDQIPRSTPPATLIPLLLAISNPASEPRQFSRSEEKLIAEITSDNSILAAGIEQLQEALSGGVEDIFIDTAIMVLKDLIKTDKAPADRFILWCLQSAAEHEFSPALLISRLKSLKPQAEVYRLTALSMITTDPDIALLFWIRFLLSRLHAKDMSAQETEAALEILREIHDGASAFISSSDDLDAGYMDNLEGLVRMLIQELDSAFPHLRMKSSFHFDHDPFAAIAGLSLSAVPGDRSLDFRGTRTETGSAAEGDSGKIPEYSDTQELTPAETKIRRGKRHTSSSTECPEQLELFA